MIAKQVIVTTVSRNNNDDAGDDDDDDDENRVYVNISQYMILRGYCGRRNRTDKIVCIVSVPNYIEWSFKEEAASTVSRQ